MRFTLARKDIGKLLNFLIDFFMIFGFLFEFRIGIGLTTRRVVLAFAILFVLKNPGKCRRNFQILSQKAMIISISMLVLVMCIILNNMVNYGLSFDNTNISIRYILYIVLYIFFFPIYCINRFENIKDFCKVYIAVMIFQSVTIFAAALNLRFRVFLFNNTLSDQYDKDMIMAVLNGTRICGIQLMASAGSLILCTACMLLVYLVLNKYISNRCFFVNFGIIALATMLIGRTGFYIEIALMIAYFIGYRSPKKYISIIIGALAAFLVFVYAASRLDTWVIDYYKRWVGEIFYSERLLQTINWIGASRIPEFSKEMLFGTNVMKGILPTGFIMESDSGYARMYCAIGIVGCVLYYGSFFIMYLSIVWNIKDKRNKLYYLLCVLFTFVIEYKEPFFMKYFFPFTVLVLGMFIVLQERKRHENLLFNRSAF